MEQRTNAGYLITSVVEVGEYEFVLGVNLTTPNLFVTWKCKNKQDYFWGRYTNDLQKATKDLCERVLEELLSLEERGQKLGANETLRADCRPEAEAALPGAGGAAKARNAKNRGRER